MRHFGLLLWITCFAGIQALPAGELRVSPDQRILLLATERTSTMQEELDQAVQLGFHVISSASAGYDEIAYLLQRRDEPLPHGPYHLLATRRLSTMEKELNQTAARGYRLHPQSVLYNDCELVLLMEPLAREDARYQYRVLGTERTSTLQRELEEAYAQGFHLVDLVSADDNIAVLERETRP